MIDISTGIVNKNEMYSIKLNMDTASKEKIDKANEKLVEALDRQGEHLASQRVQALINEQKYHEGIQTEGSNTDELLKVNQKILAILEQLSKNKGTSEITEVIRSIKSDSRKKGFDKQYVENNSYSMSFWGLLDNIINSLFSWKNIAKLLGVGGGGAVGIHTGNKVLDKILNKKLNENVKTAETEKVKSEKVNAKAEEKIKTQKPNVKNVKADKAEKVMKEVGKEKSFAEHIKVLKKIKTPSAQKLLNNPITKGAIAGGKFAGQFAKFLLPIVAVYSAWKTSDELGLEGDDVSWKTRLTNAFETTINFATFGLVGENNIWLQSSQSIENFFPEDVRNGSLRDQITYVKEVCIPYVDGIYGKNGLEPDMTTYRKIRSRFDLWIDVKERELRKSEGKETDLDKAQNAELQKTIDEYRMSDVTGVNAYNGNDHHEIEDAIKHKNNQWYSNISDNIIDKNIFSKDEVKSWEDVRHFSREQIDYLRSSGNFSEADNLIFDKMIENNTRDTAQAVTLALEENRDLYDEYKKEYDSEIEKLETLDEDSEEYETLRDKLDNDKERLDELSKIVVSLKKTQSDMSVEFQQKADLMVQEFDNTLVKQNEVIQETQDKLSDTDKIIEQNTAEQKKANALEKNLIDQQRQDSYLKAHDEDESSFPNKTFPSFQQYSDDPIVNAMVNRQVQELSASGVSTEYFSGTEISSSEISKYAVNAPRYPVSDNESENVKTVYDKLTQNGFTHAGAVGLLGNLRAESKVKAHCVQKGMGFSDDQFAYMLDQLVNSDMDKKQLTNTMVKPPFRSVGYGLAQWTTAERKAGLVLKARQKGTSVSDINTQMEFLLDELNSQYKGVKDVLTSTDSIPVASTKVLFNFEAPAHKEQQVKYRIGLSNGIEDLLKKQGVDPSNTQAQVSQEDNQGIQSKTENTDGQPPMVENTETQQAQSSETAQSTAITQTGTTESTPSETVQPTKISSVETQAQREEVRIPTYEESQIIPEYLDDDENEDITKQYNDFVNKYPKIAKDLEQVTTLKTISGGGRSAFAETTLEKSAYDNVINKYKNNTSVNVKQGSQVESIKSDQKTEAYADELVKTRQQISQNINNINVTQNSKQMTPQATNIPIADDRMMSHFVTPTGR